MKLSSKSSASWSSAGIHQTVSSSWMLRQVPWVPSYTWSTSMFWVWWSSWLFLSCLFLSLLPHPFSTWAPIHVHVWRSMYMIGWPHTNTCIGAHGWVVEIASHGSILLPRGRLIILEAPGHPRHPSSLQIDAVVELGESTHCSVITQP